MSNISDGFSYLSPSDDLVAWGNPVVVADTSMVFDVDQSGDGTFWIASLVNGEIQVRHDIVESSYVISIEVKDKGNNSIRQDITNITVSNEPSSHPPGDIDDSGAVDLSDAILALQVGTGITPSSTTIRKEADVNSDGKIGLEEVIYILQKVSGLR